MNQNSSEIESDPPVDTEWYHPAQGPYHSTAATDRSAHSGKECSKKQSKDTHGDGGVRTKVHSEVIGSELSLSPEQEDILTHLKKSLESSEAKRTHRKEELIPEPSIDLLTSEDADLYDTMLGEFYGWMVVRGRAPKKADGLSESTANNYISRLDQVLRQYFVDSRFLPPSSEMADDIIHDLSEGMFTRSDGNEYDEGSKRKFSNALKKFFEYTAWEFEHEKWSPPIDFSSNSHNARENFAASEWNDLRDLTESYHPIPAWSEVKPEEREQIRRDLAQKLGKPIEYIHHDMWDRVYDSLESRSLLAVSLDIGPRPIEIKKFRTYWYIPEKKVVRIPKEDDSKGSSQWECALLSETAELVEAWLEQRAELDKYEDTDRMWLNKSGNPHTPGTLNKLLDEFMNVAGINHQHRSLSWYSIRHTAATHFTSKSNLHAARKQFRHKSIDMTLRYVHPTIEEQREILKDSKNDLLEKIE